jgi:hypothetical protein
MVSRFSLFGLLCFGWLGWNDQFLPDLQFVRVLDFVRG